jgi:phosphoglycolate phosphatase
MKDLIIFDYDGVIVNSFSTVHQSYIAVCKKVGVGCPEDLEEFRKVFGKNSSEAYRNLGIDPEHPGLHEMYREERLKKEPELFEGITEVIEELSEKYKLVVISTAIPEELKRTLGKYDLLKYFSKIIGTRINGVRYAKDRFIEEVVTEFGVKKNNVILIGDREVDFEDGTKTGLKKIILVEYGWGYNKDNVPKQDFLVHMPKDLLEAVRLYEES